MIYESKKLVFDVYLMDGTFTDKDYPAISLKTEPPEWVVELMHAGILKVHPNELGKCPAVLYHPKGKEERLLRLPVYICRDLYTKETFASWVGIFDFFMEEVKF